MSGFGQPPSGGGGGFGPPPGGGGGQPPAGGGGFGQPPAGGGGFGEPAGGAPGGGFAPAPAGPGGGEPKTETLAIVAAVFGVLSLPSCCCYCFPIPLVAIICGFLGLKKIGADPMLKGKELAYVGIGGGGLGILLVVVAFILNLLGAASPSDYYGSY